MSSHIPFKPVIPWGIPFIKVTGRSDTKVFAQSGTAVKNATQSGHRISFWHPRADTEFHFGTLERTPYPILIVLEQTNEKIVTYLNEKKNTLRWDLERTKNV